MSFEIVEQADRLAAAWHRHYDRLYLHTPKQHSALPFLPFPREYPRYPSRAQLIEYFERYARAFEIAPRFSERVRAVRWAGEHWVIGTSAGSWRSRAVVVATGLNAVPVIPEWPGRADFGGAVLHSAAYRTGAAFRGKRVLVVGFGNSGGEIAIDLVEHGARVGLAVRSAVNIMPRDVLGIPIVSITLRTRWLPPPVLDAVAGVIQRVRVGDLTSYGLAKRPYGPATQIAQDARIPLVDVGTIGLVKRGAIRVHPGIQRFTADGVEFVDGSRERFDAVVLATGYRPALDFLEPGTVPDDPRQLPRRGAPASPRGLYFTGFHVTSTGSLRQIGIEARNIARHIAAGQGT